LAWLQVRKGDQPRGVNCQRVGEINSGNSLTEKWLTS
jgi:hypothetical protein